MFEEREDDRVGLDDVQPTDGFALRFQILVRHHFTEMEHPWRLYLRTWPDALHKYLDANAQCNHGFRIAAARNTFFFELKKRRGQQISEEQRRKVAYFLHRSGLRIDLRRSQYTQILPRLWMKRVRNHLQLVPTNINFVPPVMQPPEGYGTALPNFVQQVEILRQDELRQIRQASAIRRLRDVQAQRRARSRTPSQLSQRRSLQDQSQSPQSQRQSPRGQQDVLETQIQLSPDQSAHSPSIESGIQALGFSQPPKKR